MAMQDMNRQEMRQIIGRNLACMVTGVATSTVDTSSLLDTYTFVRYSGDDEINGRQVIIYDATGSIVDGSKSTISDYTAATWDATCTPVFSASITTGDKFELWEIFSIEDIHDLINLAIISVTKDTFKHKVSEAYFTEKEKYVYDCLSGFAGLYKVEYCSFIDIYHDLHSCDTAWDESVDSDVTLTVNSTIHREGTACNKLVVAAGASANDILATDNFTAVDISDCDKLEIWLYSTVTLTAGQLQVLLDDTASCASALESLNIPATTANTWTRHVISLANPYLDTAIISIGLKYVTDIGAVTLYIDDIKATNSKSKAWREISPAQFSITQDTTKYLQLTQSLKNSIGDNRQLRLSGYQEISQLTDETTDCDIDPEYVIAYATAKAMLGHAKSPRLDIHDRKDLGAFYAKEAHAIKTQIRTNTNGNTIWL